MSESSFMVPQKISSHAAQQAADDASKQRQRIVVAPRTSLSRSTSGAVGSDGLNRLSGGLKTSLRDERQPEVEDMFLPSLLSSHKSIPEEVVPNPVEVQVVVPSRENVQPMKRFSPKQRPASDATSSEVSGDEDLVPITLSARKAKAEARLAEQESEPKRELPVIVPTKQALGRRSSCTGAKDKFTSLPQEVSGADDLVPITLSARKARDEARLAEEEAEAKRELPIIVPTKQVLGRRSSFTGAKDKFTSLPQEVSYPKQLRKRSLSSVSTFSCTESSESIDPFAPKTIASQKKEEQKRKNREEREREVIAWA